MDLSATLKKKEEGRAMDYFYGGETMEKRQNKDFFGLTMKEEDINGIIEILKKSLRKNITVTIFLILLGLYFIYNTGHYTGQLIYHLIH